MQNKGIIKLFAIVFGLICIYYLSFSWTSYTAEKDAALKATENGILNVAKEKELLDSTKIDYLFSEFTYKEAKDKAINLGLDLKGGINATLEISVKDILINLSNKSTNAVFNEALAKADEMQKSTPDPYLTLFVNAFEEVSKGETKLSDASIFGNRALNESDEVDSNMPNEKLKPILERKINASIATAFKVLRTRIDRFGVTQPNLQRIGSTGRILIELPGAKDIKRAEDLIVRAANLQFWEVFETQELQQFLLQANQKLATIIKPETIEKVKDTVKKEDESGEDLLTDETPKDSTDIKANSPLLSLLSINPQPNSPALGTASVKDTKKINEYLNYKEVRALLPINIRYAKFLWDVPKKDSETVRLYAVKSNRDDEAPIQGDVISRAEQEFNSFTNKPEISMTMKGQAAKKWAKMTEKNVGKFVAVVLDDYIYTAPQVNGPIPNGRTSISGAFTVVEAQDIANALQSGKLPASAHIIQSEIVGPSLGQEAIDSGVMSFMLALALILLWMVFYYGKAGIATDIALAINMVFIFGVLAAFGAVLTLPGIAGIVLTIGMAVDANVLIYERIKEELDHGKVLKDAITAGYKGSLSSILDANITTLLTGIILYSFGSGPVKGFATTLIIGILTSLFSAIFISRLLIEWYVNRGGKLTFNTSITKNWFKNIDFNFLGKRKIMYILSSGLVIIGLISLITQGLNYGVDFAGGRTYTVRFAQDVSPTEVAKSLENAFGGAPEVKTYGNSKQLKITTKYRIDENGVKVEDELQSVMFESLKPFLPDGTTFDSFKVSAEKHTVGVMEKMQVGPTIADDIKLSAIWAIFGSLIIVFIYILIRFRKWQFSLGAVVAVFHDVLIVLGVFSLLQKFLPFEEINQAFIAAILTVVGYSLNDTVVIFDRIREFANDHKEWTYTKVVNRALSSTLGRTINTSLTTLVTLLTIFIFGGDSIKGFMFAMIIGIVVGTYSSLFVASPIMFDTLMRGNKNSKE
jgi:SecD/SecF fusion protein